MKTKKLMQFATCIIVAIVTSISAYGLNNPIKDPTIPIQISQLPRPATGAPRSSTTIEAFLDTEMFTIDVYLRNAGESVTVDIENTTTGSTYQYSVSGNGSDVLPINSTSGFWTITFTLSDGRVYYGEFII